MRGLRVVVVAALGLAGREAFAQCRLVVELGSETPVIEPQQRVSYRLRRNVLVGEMCPGQVDPGMPMGTPDAAPVDASVRPDAGDKGIDAAVPADAGKEPVDDAAPDAMSIPDAGAPDAAPAPCEVRYGDLVTMTVQPRFSTGPDGARFALLMVTPRTPVVGLEEVTFFTALDEATRPSIIYNDFLVEDRALGYQCDDPKFSAYGMCSGTGGGGGGSTQAPALGCGAATDSSGGGEWQSPPLDPSDYAPPSDAGLPDHTEMLGPYEVAVLGTHDIYALADWFDAHDYAYTPADLAAINPYLARDWNVVAVRMAVGGAIDEAALEPLSFTWEGDAMTLPVALSNGPGAIGMPVRLYVNGDGRYEFPGAIVSYAQPVGGGFLTRSEMWTTPGAAPDNDPTAYRNPGDPTYRDEQVVDREIHIPLSSCPRCSDLSGSGGGSERGVCGCRLGPRDDGLPGTALLGLLVVAALRLGRRRGARRRSG